MRSNPSSLINLSMYHYNGRIPTSTCGMRVKILSPMGILLTRAWTLPPFLLSQVSQCRNTTSKTLTAEAQNAKRPRLPLLTVPIARRGSRRDLLFRICGCIHTARKPSLVFSDIGDMYCKRACLLHSLPLCLDYQVALSNLK
jgi:hypothetical protein